jgi:glycosyltransferase involved in cell wall biosynthesis
MDDRPLRVLAVADAQSIHTLRWARRLADRGHALHIVSNRVAVRPADAEGLHIHDVRTLDALTRVKGVRRLRFGAAIRNLARREHIDVMHGHGTAPYAYWGALAGFHPYVVSPWGRDVLVDARQEPGKTRARKAFDAADWVVVNSGAIEDAAIEAGADPARITHILWHTQLAGFGPERGDPAGLRRELGFPDDALVVMSLRNFQHRTNIDVLVRAFSRLVREEPRARLVLAARAGETKAEIEALVAELGLGDVVRFHRVEPEELPVLAASGDVVVSIADTDSSPSSLLEAMASGRAMVGGWCPSIDEWIEQGEGAEMVPPKDEDAVLAALRRLLADEGLRRSYGERNRRVVQERVAESAPALESLYRQLMARVPARV